MLVSATPARLSDLLLGRVISRGRKQVVNMMRYSHLPDYFHALAVAPAFKGALSTVKRIGALACTWISSATM